MSADIHEIKQVSIVEAREQDVDLTIFRVVFPRSAGKDSH